ncbi:MAG: nicotinate-nucleotide--dimethylbenzimidazole phosphoribosyltransferase [Gammaproteobacteria bacterium]|nr:nicotinate-nucleotide--dimethylbenzimidazole phosphoribosyltransferase [Gammaproteobacteria bacterium]MBU1654680.1 nicotinate-nucleotide--dimethylbenzimidazole phosphoribosyltransferase [Gammaproteobacteria bacterium]MBU1961404.1 nicotinate-nucleotide--dimethylbenzimidazole phosphoribosyltransferase [Gammaproteobacteria bacterium]
MQLVLFAGDHGIADEVLAATPRADTAAGMGEALRGAGTIGRMARDLGAGLEVIDLGRTGEGGAVAGVMNCTLGPGKLKGKSAIRAGKRRGSSRNTVGVIVRGNNRDPIFYADGDYPFYLEKLKQACDRFYLSPYLTFSLPK